MKSIHGSTESRPTVRDKKHFDLKLFLELIVPMLSNFLRVGLVSGCVVMAIGVWADDKPAVDPKLLPPPSTKQGVTYATDIQPIFAKSCYPCHGPKTPKPKGKLRLDTLALVLKGGEDGPALVVG